jgi:hypothetical protein
MAGVEHEDGTSARLGARFGPYFALDQLGPRGPLDGGERGADGWLPVAELADPASVAFNKRMVAVRTALAAGRAQPPEAVDPRVAVSVAQLGLCARLVAPALALTVAGDGSITLDPRWIFWRDVLGGPFPLGLDHPLPAGDPATRGRPDRLAAGFTAGVLTPVVAPIVEAVAAAHPVSRHVLWGNVASAVAGAAKMMGRAEPALAQPAWRVVDELCEGADGPLRGAGRRVDAIRFRRRSCCLIYRLAQAGARAVCEDCVLAAGSPAEVEHRR